MKRKEFVQKICMAGIGGALGVSFLESCASLSNLYNVKDPIKEDALWVPLEAFKSKGKGLPYLVVHHDELKFPICVYNPSEQEFTALWMQCTHQGAELQVFGNKLECPAHGSEFDSTGKVENGPASQDLRTFETALSGEYLKIILR